MRILVVDDQVKLAEYVRQGLTESGYVVDVAHNGVDGLHLALEGQYDLLILDIMLPGTDGLAVLRAVRMVNTLPVMLLSARDKTEDRVLGLQIGADDYVVKPFSFTELLARVQALLRRSTSRSEVPPSVLKLDDLEVDLLRRRVRRGSLRLELTSKEFNLLALLLRRSGEVLSRTVLSEQIWDMNFDSDTNVVDVAISRLRAKLDDPFQVKLLHTVRGMGYVLELREER